jgi:uncharacterized protein GlcG (DUF336 family)
LSLSDRIKAIILDLTLNGLHPEILSDADDSQWREKQISKYQEETPQAKAVAAVAFRKGTDELAISREKFPAFWGTVPSIASEPLLPSKGGVPLRVNGHVIGAVGCSGASSEDDHKCAIAGASKVE